MRIRIRRKPNSKPNPKRIERAYRAMLLEQELEKKKDHWLYMQRTPYEL
jgi:hypothetical protein